nr:hypothetical protein [Xenorhabdus sp. M]
MNIPITFGGQPFTFQTPEHPFHWGVIIAAASATHALDNLISPEQAAEYSTRVLTSLIRMKNQSTFNGARFQRIVQRPTDQFGIR